MSPRVRPSIRLSHSSWLQADQDQRSRLQEVHAKIRAQREKEQDEVEVEVMEEAEGELSEEEEDDEDSQSQSQDKIQGVAAGESTNVQDLGASGSQPAGGGTPDGTAGSSTGSEGVDSDSNGNGQKLLNGGGGGGANSQTGVLGSFGGGVSHLDYTGPIDTSSHDFLLSLMGIDSFEDD
ncbi:hypothetical protein ABVT39_021992 [Epinephelus coioides]